MRHYFFYQSILIVLLQSAMLSYSYNVYFYLYFPNKIIFSFCRVCVTVVVYLKLIKQYRYFILRLHVFKLNFQMFFRCLLKHKSFWLNENKILPKLIVTTLKKVQSNKELLLVISKFSIFCKCSISANNIKITCKHIHTHIENFEISKLVIQKSISRFFLLPPSKYGEEITNNY